MLRKTILRLSYGIGHMGKHIGESFQHSWMNFVWSLTFVGIQTYLYTQLQVHTWMLGIQHHYRVSSLKNKKGFSMLHSSMGSKVWKLFSSTSERMPRCKYLFRWTWSSNYETAIYLTLSFCVYIVFLIKRAGNLSCFFAQWSIFGNRCFLLLISFADFTLRRSCNSWRQVFVLGHFQMDCEIIGLQDDILQLLSKWRLIALL